MTRLTPEQCADVVFDILVECALKGERCPGNGRYKDSDPPTLPELFKKRVSTEQVLPAGLMTDMTDRGWIRIEISGKNWRVVEICKGEHAGKRTKENPSSRFVKAHRVFKGKGGTL